MLFEQAAYLYIQDKTEGRKPVRPNTLEGYLSAIKCHLMPRWCGVEIEAINADQLQAWVDDFDKPGSAAKAFKTIRQILRWYMRRQRHIQRCGALWESHLVIYRVLATRETGLRVLPEREPNHQGVPRLAPIQQHERRAGSARSVQEVTCRQ